MSDARAFPYVGKALLAAVQEDDRAMVEAIQALCEFGAEMVFPACCTWAEVFLEATGISQARNSVGSKAFVGFDVTDEEGRTLHPDSDPVPKDDVRVLRFIIAIANNDVEAACSFFDSVDSEEAAFKFLTTLLESVGTAVRGTGYPLERLL